MSNDTPWSLEEAELKSKEIQFWRSEYMKRALIFEDEYEEILQFCKKFSCEWHNYLYKHYKNLIPFYNKSFMNLLQNAYSYIRRGGKYVDPYSGLRFYDEFIDFIGPRIEELNFLHRLSFTYDYYAEDLINPTDMNIVLCNIDNTLPEPPMYYLNKNHEQYLPHDVLNVLSIHNCVQMQVQKNSKWRPVLDDLYNTQSPNDFIQINEYGRSADFIVLCKILHSDFNIELAIKDIYNYLVYTIWKTKTLKNIKLSDEEKKLICNLYKNFTSGEYGSTYKESRAIGLWLWDRVYMNKISINRTNAVKSFREQCKNNSKFAKGHHLSSDRTLLRLLENAENCINSGEVKSIKKLRKK